MFILVEVDVNLKAYLPVGKENPIHSFAVCGISPFVLVCLCCAFPVVVLCPCDGVVEILLLACEFIHGLIACEVCSIVPESTALWCVVALPVVVDLLNLVENVLF